MWCFDKVDLQLWVILTKSTQTLERRLLSTRSLVMKVVAL